MPIKRLGNLLNPNDDRGLGEIIQHARDMGQLLQRLQQSVPGDSAASITAANIRDDGELVILVSSPAWAAKLRFEAANLMAAARESGAQITSCTVRVARN